MAEDKIGDDAAIALAAIRSASAAHTTGVAKHTEWAWRWMCSCGDRSVETDFGTASFEGRQHEDRARSLAILTALAAAGRLLPTGQKRTEYGVIHETLGEFHRCWVYPDCHDWFPAVHNKQRTVTAFDDGSTLVGPWVAVDEGSGTA